MAPRQYFNWSYMRETFVDEVANWHTQPILPKGAKNPPPLVTCKPEPHFARKLPWFITPICGHFPQST